MQEKVEEPTPHQQPDPSQGQGRESHQIIETTEHPRESNKTSSTESDVKPHESIKK